MASLHHSPLFDHVRDYLRQCRPDETIFLFAPYIKTNVIERLLEGIQNRIVVVTTWEPKDIQFGSSELSLYPYCKDRGISLYVSENMHLKVYSVSLSSAVIATGNISRNGLLPDGNYEVSTIIEHLTGNDRLFFEKIRKEARLVDDAMYEELVKWSEKNQIERSGQVDLTEIISAPKRDDFLISALPMTSKVDDLVSGYERIESGLEPSDDSETAACIFHDLANYGVPGGLSRSEFIKELSCRFFAHPFIQRIDEFIAPEAYFGRIKEWVQDNCTDVPVPSRRELTGNVQVLLEWFEALGGGRYKIDVPGARSQRIRKA